METVSPILVLNSLVMNNIDKIYDVCLEFFDSDQLSIRSTDRYFYVDFNEVDDEVLDSIKASLADNFWVMNLMGANLILAPR